MSLILGVIPARYGSSRFPGKPLIDLGGKPMIQRVWEAASRCKRLSRLLVATDDERIARVVRAFGGEAVMTPASCPTGTDRIALAARPYKAGMVVNIQGDEPLLPPGLVDQLVDALRDDPRAAMATLCHPFRSRAEFQDPNAVKVVMDFSGNALYFSRAGMPHWRGQPRDFSPLAAKHIGLYAYRGWFLQKFTRLKPGGLEKTEALEQLRALEHGYRIKVARAAHGTQAVDTPLDAQRVRRALKQSGHS